MLQRLVPHFITRPLTTTVWFIIGSAVLVVSPISQIMSSEIKVSFFPEQCASSIHS